MVQDLPLPVLCGQLVVGGFPGPALPAELARALQAGERAGVILFKRNLPSLEAARALAEAATRASPAELPPFVSVDQEGGRVARLGAPLLELPPMRALGRLDDAELARRTGAVLGRELGALGINLDFAPVLDVDSNPANPVIGDRAFGTEPGSVARLGVAFALGLEQARILSCGKHFPGHGDTAQDSHLDLPTVDQSEQRLRRVELPPFIEAARAGLASLMTAHVVYPALAPDTPATLSPRICTELLRAELGFQGVLFSDDLEMKALADRMTPEQSSVAAIRAGCDVLLVCSQLDWQARAHAALVREAERDPAFRARVVQAAGRSLAARRRCPPEPCAPGELAARIGDAEARALAAELRARLAT